MLSLPFTPALAQVIEGGHHVAERLGDGQVGAKHLLLAVIEGGHSCGRDALDDATAGHAESIWRQVWTHAKRLEPSNASMTVEAESCIEHAAAAARIRGAFVVTTYDLMASLSRCTSEDMIAFFEAAGLTPEALDATESERVRFEARLLKGPILRNPAGFCNQDFRTGGPRRRVVSVDDGTIYASLLAARTFARSDVLSTMDLLNGVQSADQLRHYPAARITSCGARLPMREVGSHDVLVGDVAVQLTTPAMAALLTAYQMRDAYGFGFVKHDFIVSALLVVANSQTRLAFEMTLLRGLPTTWDHLDEISGIHLDDLPKVLTPIRRELRAWLDADEDHLVDIESERWRTDDADPIQLVDLLFAAMTDQGSGHSASHTHRWRSRTLEVCRLLDHQFNSAHRSGSTFFGVAGRCMAVTGIALGDPGILRHALTKIAATAIADGHVRAFEDLETWDMQLTSPAPETPDRSTIERHVQTLYAATSPADVVRHASKLKVWPTREYVGRLHDAHRSYAGTLSEFAMLDGITEPLDRVAALGYETVYAESMSPKVRLRVAKRLPSVPITPEIIAASVVDKIAEDGVGRTLEILERLQAAAPPIDIADFRDDLNQLEFIASYGLGHEREVSHLGRYVAAKMLLAEKVADLAEANAAAESALDALRLLCVEDYPGLARVTATVLRQWQGSVGHLADRPSQLDSVAILTIQLLIRAVGNKNATVELMEALEGVRLGVSDVWYRAATESLGLSDVAREGVLLTIRSHVQINADVRARVNTLVEVVEDAIRDLRSDPTYAHLLRVESSSVALLELDALPPNVAAHVLTRLCISVTLCLAPLDQVRSVAARVATMVDEFVRGLSGPIVGWDALCRYWLEVATIDSLSSQICAESGILRGAAQGYVDARSHAERRSGAGRLRLSAEAAAIRLARQGAFEEAAVILEMTADLARQDRVDRWAPPVPATAIKKPDLSPGLAVGALRAEPFTMALRSTPAEPIAPRDWLADRRASVEARTWPTDVDFLVLVPGSGETTGGAILLLRDGNWSGISASNLDYSAFEGVVLNLFGSDASPGRAIDLLRRALPNDLRMLLRTEKPIVLVPRAWLTVTPLHAAVGALRTEASGPSTFTYATSVQAWIEATAQATPSPVRPTGALVVCNPRPSLLPSLRHSYWEADRLVHGGVDVRTLPLYEASKAAILAALGSRPPIFHFAGHAGLGNLVTAYDNGVSASEILHLDADPPRLTVLSACSTAAPSFHTSDEGLSLVAAFSETRCPGVIGNLWPVDDLATALVMDFFYEHFEASGWLQPAEALQKATTWLRNASYQECVARLEVVIARGNNLGQPAESLVPPCAQPYNDPVYWAPFVLYGV